MTIEQAITALNNHQRVYRAPQDYNSTPIYITRIERIANWQGQHTVCHCTQGPDLIKTTLEELHLICPAQLEYKKKQEEKPHEVWLSKEQVERFADQFNPFLYAFDAKKVKELLKEKEMKDINIKLPRVPSITVMAEETHNHYNALLPWLDMLTDEELKHLESECKRIRYIRS